ncbi:hypothetical protein Pfo_014327 [Paulownia fortunei]|nr:hypothetical protein Pfo_014327 [Paulownia fortunei]
MRIVSRCAYKIDAEEPGVEPAVGVALLAWNLLMRQCYQEAPGRWGVNADSCLQIRGACPYPACSIPSRILASTAKFQGTHKRKAFLGTHQHVRLNFLGYGFCGSDF